MEPGCAIADVPDITIPASNQYGAYVPLKHFPTATDDFDPAHGHLCAGAELLLPSRQDAGQLLRSDSA